MSAQPDTTEIHVRGLMAFGSLLRRAVRWIGIWILPILILAVFYVSGYYHGHRAGRLEMKCAIFAVVEQIGGPAPGTITLGCDKRPAKQAAAA